MTQAQELLCNKHKRIITKEISNFGIAIIDAFVDQGHEELYGLRFAYTIGMFSSFGLPELVVFGKKPNEANDILNFFYAYSKKYIAENTGDASFALPVEDRTFYETFPSLIGGEKVFYTNLIDTNIVSSICPYMSWFYINEPFSALQIVYPDAFGVWEWEKRCKNKSLVNPLSLPIIPPQLFEHQ